MRATSIAGLPPGEMSSLCILISWLIKVERLTLRTGLCHNRVGHKTCRRDISGRLNPEIRDGDSHGPPVENGSEVGKGGGLY